MPSSTSTTPTKPLINLLRGWPAPSLLPASRIAQAGKDALADPAIAIPALQYGPDEGYPLLRSQVATWLHTFYGATASNNQDEIAAAITADRICITGGASQNLACLLQVFSDPLYTRNVWMIAPTYFLACRIFHDSGFATKLRGVPEDEEGVDIEFLRREIQKSEDQARKEGNTAPKVKPPRPWSKAYKHIIYGVPTFSNPSSKIMSLRRREQLVSIAREFDALIITDDVYDMLQWSTNQSPTQPETAALPRIVDIDRTLGGGPIDEFGHAVSNGSFSKLIGPGCRTGWAEGTAKLVYGLSQVGSSRSGGAPSHLVSTFISQLFNDGFLNNQIHNVLQPAYAQRYYSMIFAVEQHLVPLGITLPQPDRDIVGGFFIWLTLPSPLDGDVVAQRALQEENLVVAQGSLFQVQGDVGNEGMRFERDIRLCFTWEDEEILSEGVERLARVIKRLIETGDGGRSAALVTVGNDDDDASNAFK